MNPLDKPVHTLLIPVTHLEKLQNSGKFYKNKTSIEVRKNGNLPVEKSTDRKEFKAFSIPPNAKVNSVQQMQRKVKLRVIHNAVEEPTGDKKPPCDTCNTAPCCKAYVVNITKEEYDSGLYGDYAVKLTTEAKTQLMDNIYWLPVVVSMFESLTDSNTTYHLEGRRGDACPFLTSDNKCGIYDTRPVACRTYTCVGSKVITQEMRDGTEDVPTLPDVEYKRREDK